MAVWILDASHGGNDSGIAGGNIGRREADVVLEAVLEAKKHLERNGETVILTRTGDETIDIESRVKIAKENKGQFFISFHMNSHIDKKVKGVQTFYIKEEEKNERLARMIRDEIASGLRTEDKGVFKDENNCYDDVNIIGVLVYGEYLSNEEVEWNFDGKKYGMLVAKGCLAIVDKVLLTTPISQPKKLQKNGWRVCVGYYNDYDSAIEEVRELNRNGIKDAYVVPYDGR